MIDPIKNLAVVTASLFAGAALYINVAEHPARMLLDTHSAVSQWAPSYTRATWMQAPLAVVSFLAGAALWLTGNGVAWLIAAALIGAVVPLGIGMEKREAMTEYSVLGVTKAEAWLPETLGIGPMICLVLKSRRSTRATRPFMSLTKSQRPS